MKKINLLLLILFTTYSFSQEITADAPEFIGEIIYVDAENNTYELEMQTAALRTGKSVGRMVTGAGKVKAIVVVKGAHSPVEVKKSDKIHFIYNNGSNDISPRKVVQLLNFESKKKTREYLWANSSNITGQNTAGEMNLINFKGKKYGDSSYLLIISDLAVGEYAFFLGETESRDAYLFSVVE